jgi:hypothetical protein
VYVEDHVGGSVAYGGIIVGCEIVEEVVQVFLGAFSGTCLCCCNGAEGNKGGDVYGSRVIEDGTDELL